MEPAAWQYRGMVGHRSGIVAILGAMLVQSLFLIGVTLHPESLNDTGGSLLLTDTVLVILFGGAGVWVARQRNAEVNAPLKVGAVVGYILAIAHIAHHMAEFFTPLSGGTALFVLGAGHMLMIFAFFCIAGSVARERTYSIVLPMVAGLWSAILSVLILIAFGLSSNLLFGSRVLLRMHGAFLESGISDPGAFVVRNALEAALEALVCIPVLGLILSLAGGLANAWMSHRARRTVLILAWSMPISFAAAAMLLWYANSLERADRPPFIMTGLMLASVSLISVHSVWRALRRGV